MYFEKRYIECESKFESENNKGVIYSINPWNKGQMWSNRAMKLFDGAHKKNPNSLEVIFNKSVLSMKIGEFDIVTDLFELLRSEITTNDLIHYNAGIAFHETGNDSEALSCFSKVSGNELSRKAGMNLGILFEENGRNDDAMTSMQGLFTGNIGSDAYLIKAHIAKSTYNEKNIPRLLKMSLLNNKDNNKARMALSDYYTSSDNFKKAERRYRSLIKDGFFKSEANTGLAYSLYAVGDYDKALRYYNNALFYNEQNVYALNGAGLSEMNNGNYYSALNYFNDAIQIDKNFVLAYIGKAIVYYMTGNTIGSCSSFDQAFDIDSNFIQTAEVYIIASRVNMAEGMNDKARNLLLRAISVDSSSFLPYFELGNLEQSLNNYSLSIDYYGQALNLAPGCFECLINKGNAELFYEKNREAYEDFKKAYGQKPENINALNGLGNAAAEIDKFQEAFTYFEEAILLYPEKGYLFSALGICKDHFARNLEYIGYSDSAQILYEQSIDDFKTGMSVDPGNNLIYENNMGVVYKDLGKYSTAFSLFSKNNTAACLNNRGIVYALQGDKINAIRDLEEASKIDSTKNISIYLYNKLHIDGMGYQDFTKDSLVLEKLLKTEKKRKSYYKTDYIDIYYYRLFNENIENKEIIMPFAYDIKLPDMQEFSEKYYMFPTKKVKVVPELEKKHKVKMAKNIRKQLSVDKCVKF